MSVLSPSNMPIHVLVPGHRKETHVLKNHGLYVGSQTISNSVTYGICEGSTAMVITGSSKDTTKARELDFQSVPTTSMVDLNINQRATLSMCNVNALRFPRLRNPRNWHWDACPYNSSRLPVESTMENTPTVISGFTYIRLNRR